MPHTAALSQGNEGVPVVRWQQECDGFLERFVLAGCSLSLKSLQDHVRTGIQGHVSVPMSARHGRSGRPVGGVW